MGTCSPILPKQPGYHKRLKAAAPLLAAVMDDLAREVPSWHDQVRLIDATPVPCGTSRETVKRSELAGMGGLRVLRGVFALVLGPEAVPAHHPGRDARCLVPGQPEDRASGRWPRLLAHAARIGVLRPGLTLIGDKGFAGREFEDLVTTGFGLQMVRPDRRDEAPRHWSIGWIRQWIESVNDTLKGQLDLERHGGRTTAGVYARIALRSLIVAPILLKNASPTLSSLTRPSVPR